MENQLVQVFENEEFGKIRTILIDGEPWFVAVDVCRALDIQNPRDTVAKVLNDDEKMLIDLNEVLKNGVTNSVDNADGIADAISGGWIKNEVNVVNEPGLYHLIFVSRKPNAVKFQRWVYHKVLPSIRKHGYYALPNATFDIDLIAKLIPEINLTEDQINLLKTATPMLVAQTNAMITRLLTNYQKNTDIAALVALDLPGEIWKWIKNYEGFYQASTFGRARSFFKGECNILIPTLGPKGYYTICLYKDDKKETGKTQKSKKTFRLNRIIAETFIPNPENKPEVHHKDDNKANNRADNLEWVTDEENKAYAHQSGLYLKGEKNPSAKLTEENVRFIRQNYKAGDPEFGNIALAERFKVSDVTITNIVTFKSWKHVQ